jgi:hypothetical protein
MRDTVSEREFLVCLQEQREFEGISAAFKRSDAADFLFFFYYEEPRNEEFEGFAFLHLLKKREDGLQIGTRTERRWRLFYSQPTLRPLFLIAVFFFFFFFFCCWKLREEESVWENREDFASEKHQNFCREIEKKKKKKKRGAWSRGLFSSIYKSLNGWDCLRRILIKGWKHLLGQQVEDIFGVQDI